MKKRVIELFSAGCPACDEAVKLVQSLLCPSCELRILDVRTDNAAQVKAKQYGVERIPAVAIEGKLADCCARGIDAETLKRLGVGSAA